VMDIMLNGRTGVCKTVRGRKGGVYVLLGKDQKRIRALLKKGVFPLERTLLLNGILNEHEKPPNGKVLGPLLVLKPRAP